MVAVGGRREERGGRWGRAWESEAEACRRRLRWRMGSRARERRGWQACFGEVLALDRALWLVSSLGGMMGR